MASSVHFLDVKGKPLLSRDYRGDIPASALDDFPLLLLLRESEAAGSSTSADLAPFIHHNGVNYIYLAHENLYLLAMTRRNRNAMQIVVFLQAVVSTLQSYLKHLEEESIRDNFVVIYELLDEMMDHGLPQVTDTKMLKEYITQDYHRLERQRRMVAPPAAVTNAVLWRPDGIVYKKNEAFLDVIESINMTVAASGQVLHLEILGRIQVRSNLSGMPDVRLGLKDKGIFTGEGANARGIELEDLKFHQCVRLLKFETEKVITFIPPDGEFDVMSYRLTMPLKPLFVVDTRVKVHSHLRVEITARIKAMFKKKSATLVEVFIPLPEDSDSTRSEVTGGKAKWVPEKNALRWKFKLFNGGTEHQLKAEVGLPTVDDDVAADLFKKRPVKVNFQIPYTLSLGIQVMYFKVVEPKLQYQSYPWVRYVTQLGDDYSVRMK